MLSDLSEIAASALTMEDEASISSHCKQDFFPFPFVFVCFPLHPRRMVVFISAAHQVQPTPPSPRRKGHVLDWELVRARLGALQGRRELCLQMTSAADPHGTGSRFHHWGAKDDTAVRRVSEPRFNKPCAAPGPIPRKLVNAVSCQGSVHLRQGESAATPQPCGCQGRSSIH